MTMSLAARNTALDGLPNTVYAAFFNGGAPGVGTEVVPATLWGSGDRPAVTLAAAASGARTPSGDAALGTVAVASQAVTHIAYYDAATGGNLLGHAAYAATLTTGEAVQIPDASDVFTIS